MGGTLVEIGSDVKNLKVGDRVTCLPTQAGGFSEYFTANEERCFKLSDNVNIKHALGEPLKCIITVVRAARPEVDDCGVILGCGSMGLWCIQALK